MQRPIAPPACPVGDPFVFRGVAIILVDTALAQLAGIRWVSRKNPGSSYRQRCRHEHLHGLEHLHDLEYLRGLEQVFVAASRCFDFLHASSAYDIQRTKTRKVGSVSILVVPLFAHTALHALSLPRRKGLC